MKNRILAFTAVVLLIICLFTAYAEEMESTHRASDVIYSCTVKLSVNGAKLEATAGISGNGTCDKIGFKYIFIQEWRDGEWVTIASDYNLYSYNTPAKWKALSCTGDVSKKHRAIASGYALLDGVSDTAWCTSER